MKVQKYLTQWLVLNQTSVHTQLYKDYWLYTEDWNRFLHGEEIQQTEFDMVMSIDAVAENDPMRPQKLATITLF